MRSILFLLLLLAIVPTNAALASCDMHLLAEIPITLKGHRGHRPVVSATVNGIEGKFIFDSGADGTMLYRSALKKFAQVAKPLPDGGNYTSSGVPLDVSSTTVKTFDFAGVHYSNEALTVVNDDSEFDGLIGQSHLRNADVEYDLTAGQIRLYAPTGCTHANYPYWAGHDPVYAVDLEETSQRQPRTFGIIRVNGVFMRTLFDTGAPDTIVQANAARRAGVAPTSPDTVPTEPTYGINGSVPLKSWIGTFEKLEIGGETIRNVRLPFVDKPQANADIILGFNFFLSHRLYLSRADRKLYFTTVSGVPF
jgi:predicted aspartyl protease